MGSDAEGFRSLELRVLNAGRRLRDWERIRRTPVRLETQGLRLNVEGLGIEVSHGILCLKYLTCAEMQLL